MKSIQYKQYKNKSISICNAQMQRLNQISVTVNIITFTWVNGTTPLSRTKTSSLRICHRSHSIKAVMLEGWFLTSGFCSLPPSLSVSLILSLCSLLWFECQGKSISLPSPIDRQSSRVRCWQCSAQRLSIVSEANESRNRSHTQKVSAADLAFGADCAAEILKPY